jgi:hypothetical protein
MQVNISRGLKYLKNQEKLELIGEILNTIDEDGLIDEIRSLVNNPQWDDKE